MFVQHFVSNPCFGLINMAGISVIAQERTPPVCGLLCQSCAERTVASTQTNVELDGLCKTCQLCKGADVQEKHKRKFCQTCQTVINRAKLRAKREGTDAHEQFKRKMKTCDQDFVVQVSLFAARYNAAKLIKRRPDFRYRFHFQDRE